VSTLLATLRRPGLGLKLVAFGAGLTALAVGSALLALSAQMTASTKRFFALELRRNQNALVALQEQARDQLLTTSLLMTQSPTLRAAIETYRLESGSGDARPALVATVRREAQKILSGLGRDLLIVTDHAGRVLTAIGPDSAAPATGADLSRLPPVAQALDPAIAVDAAVGGVVLIGGVPYQIGCVPIVLQDVAIGTLLIGDRLDAAHLERLSTQLGAELVVVAAGRVLAATLAGAEAAAAQPSAGELRIDATDYVVASVPLGHEEAGQPVTLQLLHSISDAIDPLQRGLRTGFLVYGTLAVVVAGIGAAAVARTVLRPLDRFVGFVRDVAQSGDYTRRFDAARASREISSLNESYEQLLASLRASEEQLRQSQKLEAIGRLAGGVAHDFNNLLTIILSYIQLLKEEVPAGSPLRADLDQVEEAARRAGRLTHQLLAFSRKQVLQPKVLDLPTVVAGVQPMLARLVGEDIELRAVAPGPVARVRADPGQIEQVVLNLVANARDAMPKGGTVTIETRDVAGMDDVEARRPLEGMRQGPWVLMSVRDTGVGMDEATKARIFEPFFTTKEPGKGTGLGLAMVYGIVKQSGGFIWVDSAPGQGTVFRVYLPPVDEAVTVTGEHQTDALPRGSETVLVVEDELPVRELARRSLEPLGYTVLTAKDGLDALAIADRHRDTIHLLLTDVVMPHMSGREVGDRLRVRRPDLRVLFVSGYPQDTIAHHGVLEPGIELLQKPFVPADLARRVRLVLDAPPRDGARGAG
jgi:signal transduction histidine kinase